MDYTLNTGQNFCLKSVIHLKQFIQNNHHTSDMKKRGKNNNTIFIPDKQSAIIAQPGDRSFNLVSASVTPEFSSVLQRFFLAIAPMRSNQVDSAFAQSRTKLVAISAPIVYQPRRFVSGPTASSGNRYRFDGFFDELNFMRRRRSNAPSHRNTLAVDHHQKLCSFSLFGFSDAIAPFFAGEKLPSAKHSSHSSQPFSSSSPRKTRQISSQRPCSSHSLRRLQQVESLGYVSGKSRHLAPVFKTHRIPDNTSRFSAQGLPPFLPFGIVGINGSIFSHCASVNNLSFIMYTSLDRKCTKFCGKKLVYN